MHRVIFYFLIFFLRTSSARGGGGGGAARLFSFFFPCSADHERDWPPCKVVFFGLATNALNVRNNNNNNNNNICYDPGYPNSSVNIFLAYCEQSELLICKGHNFFLGV